MRTLKLATSQSSISLLAHTPTIMSLRDLPKAGRLVKHNGTYEVRDLHMEDLTLSTTLLYEGKTTTGHSHAETEEIYAFIEGEGEIDLDCGTPYRVVSGDLVLIPKGIYHRVTNTGPGAMRFACVFQQYNGRDRPANVD